MSTKAQLKAWNDITENHAQNLEEAIIIVMDQFRETGITKDELINTLKIRHQTITSRLSILQDKGKIIHNNQERGGCTLFYLAPPALWDVHASKRHFKKFQEHLNRGVKEFGMNAENVGPLLQDFIEANKITPELGIVATENVQPYAYWNLYASFHKVTPKKTRILTATFKLNQQEIDELKKVDTVIINNRLYKTPPRSKCEKMTPGINVLTLEEINPKFD